MSLLSSGWMGITAMVAVIDPVEIGARGERLTIIGILIAGVIALGIGIVALWRGQKQQADSWKVHHDETVKAFNAERLARNEERKVEYNAMLQVLRDNSAALASSAVSTKGVEVAIKSLEHTILESKNR